MNIRCKNLLSYILPVKITPTITRWRGRDYVSWEQWDKDVDDRQQLTQRALERCEVLTARLDTSRMQILSQQLVIEKIQRSQSE